MVNLSLPANYYLPLRRQDSHKISMIQRDRALSNPRWTCKRFSAKFVYRLGDYEIREMARETLILICASLILTQLVVVSAQASEQDIDWATVHDELRKLAGSVRKKCIGETGATNEMLDGAELGQFPSEDKTLACYFKCVMEKGGAMKKDGKINYKILSKLFPQAYRQIATEMLDQCRTIEGTDKCIKALNFNKCMYNANPVAYFAI